MAQSGPGNITKRKTLRTTLDNNMCLHPEWTLDRRSVVTIIKIMITSHARKSIRIIPNVNNNFQ